MNVLHVWDRYNDACKKKYIYIYIILYMLSKAASCSLFAAQTSEFDVMS